MRHIFQNPKHWLYVVCHAVLILAGLLLGRQSRDTIWFAVGGSLIAAGIAGWVIFVYVLVSEQVSDRLDVLVKFGVVKAFDARSVRIRQEYVQRLDAARDQIDIIGFGLSSLREDFGDHFAKWKPRVNVRVLLLDPEFPSAELSYARQRDNEENNIVGKIAGDVKKFIEDIGNLIGKINGHTFEIRLYQCLPTLNIFRIDDELFWGPYLVGEQSRNTPTFVVKRGGILFDRFSGQFNRIWESKQLSRDVPKEWLSKKTRSL
jgi:hypothetical protein